jgi:hypothetical protein
MTAKAIGVHSHMHKTKVSRAAALLERRKLVTRPSARSVSIAHLCRTGNLQRAGSEALDFANQLLETVDSADRAPLDRALKKVTERSAQLAPHIANGSRPG